MISITKRLAGYSDSENKIEDIREQYKPVAQRAATIYRIVKGFQDLHPMYEFGFLEFVNQFKIALERTAPNPRVQVPLEISWNLMTRHALLL